VLKLSANRFAGDRWHCFGIEDFIARLPCLRYLEARDSSPRFFLKMPKSRRNVLLAALLVIFAAIAAAPARAQLALSITSSSTQFSNVQTGTVTTFNSTNQTTTTQAQGVNFWASGLGIGLSSTTLPLGPVKFGFDLRGSVRPGATGADTLLAGIKLAVNLSRIKPYIEAEGGYLETRTLNQSSVSIVTSTGTSSAATGGFYTNRYAGWEIFGGVDYPLMRFVDLRVIEIGGGSGVDISNVGGPNVSLFSINSGIVLHF
jgi:hypothetical protein